MGVADRNQPVVVYCQTGYRAGQTYLALRSLGLEQVRLYDASMVEYAQQGSAPLAQGM